MDGLGPKALKRRDGSNLPLARSGDDLRDPYPNVLMDSDPLPYREATKLESASGESEWVPEPRLA
jgi:hypothetical protein